MPSRCPFSAAGAAVLGEFPAREVAVMVDLAAQLGGGSVAAGHRIRFKQYQRLSRLGLGSVAWLASHGRCQGIGNAAESVERRLMADLTNGAVLAGLDRLRRSARGGFPLFVPRLPAPPSRPAELKIHESRRHGHPAIADRGLGGPASAGSSSCPSDGRGRKLLHRLMGSGVGTAPARKTRLAGRAGGSNWHGTDRVGVLHPGLSVERVERTAAGYVGEAAGVN